MAERGDRDLGAVAFALKKMVDWRTAFPLLAVTTIAAPLGGRTRLPADAESGTSGLRSACRRRHEQRHRDPAVLFGLPHPHLPEARFDWTLLALTTITSIAGAQWGALFMAKRVKSLTLTRIFAAALVLLAVQPIFALLG